MVIISVKVALPSNVFIMGLQKIGVVWMIRLIADPDASSVVSVVFLSVMVSSIRVFNVRDLRSLIVYSSVANTGSIIPSTPGNKFHWVSFSYSTTLMSMTRLLVFSKRYDYGFAVILPLMTTPSPLSFVYKSELFLSVLSRIKVSRFVVFIDISMLVHYLNMVFTSSMTGGGTGFAVIIFLVLMVGGLLFRNFVTMNLFYQS